MAGKTADHRGCLVGVISDTHGVLRPEAIAALRGTDLIIHAGDIDTPDVIQGLERIAPTVAVRGNMDFGDLRTNLPETEVVEIGKRHLYLLHDLGRLDLDPVAAGFNAVISGHSHRPAVERRDGVLYLNPGSAGPRRFSYPVTVAKIRIDSGRLIPRIIDLDR